MQLIAETMDTHEKRHEAYDGERDLSLDAAHEHDGKLTNAAGEVVVDEKALRSAMLKLDFIFLPVITLIYVCRLRLLLWSSGWERRAR